MINQSQIFVDAEQQLAVITTTMLEGNRPSYNSCVVVVESWERAKQVAGANYQEEIGAIVFEQLTTLQPRIKSLFRFGDAEKRKSPAFKRHVMLIFGLLERVIQYLGADDPGALDPVPELVQLGTAHKGFGVHLDQLDFMIPVLLNAMGRTLGDENFSVEARQGWRLVLAYVISHMNMGFVATTKSPSAAAPSSETDRSSSAPQGKAQLLDLKEPEYSACVVVVDSWERAKFIAGANYKEEIGDHVFGRLLSLHPKTKKLFQFGRSQNRKKNPAFKRHVKLIFGLLDELIQNLGTGLDGMKEDLVKLGAKHKTFGVQMVQLNFIIPVMLYALGQTLGDENFSRPERTGWIKVLTFVVSHMKVGIDERAHGRTSV